MKYKNTWGGRAICTPLSPITNQYSNKILPAESCLNQKKSTRQELTELNTILLEKLLSTESCPFGTRRKSLMKARSRKHNFQGLCFLHVSLLVVTTVHLGVSWGGVSVWTLTIKAIKIKSNLCKTPAATTSLRFSGLQPSRWRRGPPTVSQLCDV